MKSTDSKPIIIPDVLCPWGCTEFCFQTEHCHLGILLQHHLRKVELNLPSAQSYRKLHLVETSRVDYFRQLLSDYDKVLLNDEWPILPCVQFVQGKGLMVMVCCHHGSPHTTKRLYPHPPRKPNHNLSAQQCDQLCHAQLQPRGFQPLLKRKHNTRSNTLIQQASSARVDSMNVSVELRFSQPSVIFMTTN